jgi:hypothetical protein
MNWETLVPVIVGGVIGLLGGLASQALALWIEGRRSRRSIAGALGGEISALCAIARRRQYLEGAELLLLQVRQRLVLGRLRIGMAADYMVVFNAHAASLGRLPPDLATDVVRFYTQAKSLLEDVRPDAPDPLTAPEAEDQLEQTIELLKDTLDLGERVSAQLRDLA